MSNKWEIYPENEKQIEDLKDKYNISKLLATILVNRNLVKKERIEKFLTPTRNDFYDPFLMPDMKLAVNRILKAIKNNEKIIIYGDYDADGITSVTVLKSFFEDRKIDVDTYIPNRLNEGYGLNMEAIKKIIDNQYTLMITVDCGITGKKEIDYANLHGVDTIVTDHHEVGEELPKAIAVIDTKREDSKYPFRELAGVGVAFKLIHALSKVLELDEKEYLKYLDIVCIGTISDIVPLVDENRVIAKLGLMLIKQTKNLGLKSMIQSSGYKKIDSTTISFGIAPRINACGRMGFAEKALELFLSKDIIEVKDLTEQLNQYNQKRQAIEKEIFENAKEQIEKENISNKNTIVVCGKNWHHGVIGIVSSKITEMYFKPSILLGFDGEEAKGSRKKYSRF